MGLLFGARCPPESLPSVPCPSRSLAAQTLRLWFRTLLSSWGPDEVTEGTTRVALCWLMQVMFRWIEIALQRARNQPSLSAGPSSPVEP
jgi:hypothetical protein